jgi:hypothetical protein
MRDISNKIKSLLFCLIIALLFLPIIQNRFELFQLEPLNGAITIPEKNYVNIKEWFSGDYQLKKEKYLNECFGFRNLFIRINNQIAFSLFNVAKANGVIIGKKNYLYEESYIKAYKGTDFVGLDSITNRMMKLKIIQDSLSKLNKTIIVVFAAGKGSYYPEYFPDKYVLPKKQTNYELYVKLAKEYHINYIDFNKYFVDRKTFSKYPLYPQYGIHWSQYGMCLVADSIIKYIEKARNIDMPNLFWNKVEMSTPRETDYDIADGMNLMFKLKSFKMAYPLVQFQSDSNFTKPNVLVVSDSFYWGMFNFGITKAFSNNHFWYYNKQVYPDSFKKGIETSQLNLNDEIDNHDVIILMYTEATIGALGSGFIENVFTVLQEKNKQLQ